MQLSKGRRPLPLTSPDASVNVMPVAVSSTEKNGVERGSLGVPEYAAEHHRSDRYQHTHETEYHERRVSKRLG
ncbi:hypothetical protein HAH_5253 (plasmid) [Haloarcula hispanica ATCC 33960]|uniref:Uncharacterized protein n=1 Tax=Haloarcula hispanica (strain ATCC 33960 / DSM 4426 / JCM 8911 / NBRC 102182 / NCIMB 2187 / VKM B-1755) TaxID=634497 RepID=G0I0G5_HALHT|nr:hypothetical protein HAH_5253 [Haloarcula hispanica ATCC 33960]